jgi:chain length determinant protein EpsF
MSLMQVFGILKARFLIIVLTILASTITAGVVVSVLPKQYLATSTILLDISTPDPVTGQMMPGSLMRTHVRTQIRLIKSERVARKVVRDLGLTRSTYFLNEFAKTDKRQEDLEYWISRRIIGNLKVNPVGVSEIIAVSYSGNSPNIAAQLANAFVDAYISIDLDLRVEPAKRNAQWFASQLNILQQNLNNAQRRLTDFQQARGILDVSDDVDAENNKLVDLTQRYTASLSDVSEAKTLFAQLEAFDKAGGKGDELPEFLTNGRLQQWRDEVTKLDGLFAERSEQLGANHPEILAIKARQEVAQAQIVEEILKLRSSLAARVRIAEEKSSVLEQELNQQKSDMLALRKDKDQLDLLRREVEIRKAEYDDAFRRAGTLRLEGDLGQTGVVVMEEAIPPLEHAFPQKTLSLILALGAGSVLGVALSFLLEMIDRRVRSHKDLEQITGKPVLTVLVAGKSSSSKLPKLLGRNKKKPIKSIKELPAAAE